MVSQTREDQLRAFASVLWDKNDLIEIRPLPPNLASQRWVLAKDLEDLSIDLEVDNAMGANIYAGVLPRLTSGASTDNDCLSGWVAWVDFDDVKCVDAMGYAMDKGVPLPTMAVNSGHGAHFYWRFTERIDKESLCELVGRLADFLGSDPSVKNPSRILRIPGFLNVKSDPVLCEIVHQNGPEYDFDSFSALVTEESTLPEPEPEKPRKKMSTENRVYKYLDKVGNASEGERNNLTYKVACILINDFALPQNTSEQMIKEWNASNHPPLPEKELMSTFKSAVKLAKGETGRLNKNFHDVEKPKNIEIKQKKSTNTIQQMHDDVDQQIIGSRETVPLPWKRLTNLSGFLRPGNLSIFAGPTGVGKSFFLMHMVLHLHKLGHKWSFLPLEDSKKDWLFRVLAILENDYSMIDIKEFRSDVRKEKIKEHQDMLIEIGKHVFENPRMNIQIEEGKKKVPTLPYGKVLDWIGKEIESSRIIVLDPITQIDFGEQFQWVAEADFIRTLLGFLSGSNSTVVLSSHTVKRSGRASSLPLTVEDIQGSSVIGKLTQNVIMMDSHEEKTSEVFRMNKLTDDVRHNRTVLIAKARNAPGAKQRVAFTQASDTPSFTELGIINPRVKKKGE